MSSEDRTRLGPRKGARRREKQWTYPAPFTCAPEPVAAANCAAVAAALACCKDFCKFRFVSENLSMRVRSTHSSHLEVCIGHRRGQTTARQGMLSNSRAVEM